MSTVTASASSPEASRRHTAGTARLLARAFSIDRVRRHVPRRRPRLRPARPARAIARLPITKPALPAALPDRRIAARPQRQPHEDSTPPCHVRRDCAPLAARPRSRRPAVAQPAPAAEGANLPTINVTDTRRLPESFDQRYATTQVLTRTDLDRLSPSDPSITQALATLPGVTVSQNGGPAVRVGQHPRLVGQPGRRVHRRHPDRLADHRHRAVGGPADRIVRTRRSDLGAGRRVVRRQCDGRRRAALHAPRGNQPNQTTVSFGGGSNKTFDTQLRTSGTVPSTGPLAALGGHLLARPAFVQHGRHRRDAALRVRARGGPQSVPRAGSRCAPRLRARQLVDLDVRAVSPVRSVLRQPRLCEPPARSSADDRSRVPPRYHAGHAVRPVVRLCERSRVHLRERSDHPDRPDQFAAHQHVDVVDA